MNLYSIATNVIEFWENIMNLENIFKVTIKLSNYRK